MARLSVPVKVRLELTRLCNLRCVHCKVACDEKPCGELTVADLRKILPQLQAAGASHLNVTGGEIFARPDAYELLEAIFELDFLVNVQTNATLLRPDHVELLKRNVDKLISVNVSGYGGRAEVHEAVTQVPGSFRKTTETLFALRDAGIPIAVFCMLMAENAAFHKETQEFFAREGIHFQFGALMISREDGCAMPLDHRVGDSLLGELPIPWDRYLNPDPESVPERYTPETPITEWCVVGRFPTVLPNGDLVPCSVIREPVGNLREKTFEEIWNNSPALDYFRSLTVKDLECRDCEYFPRCKPCLGIAFSEQGSYTARPLEYCRLTKKYLKI